jgi:AcrR family transcriptional regulator
MSDVRMPTQKRSIEKKNRIIEKGFELMCENGYYNTTIPDIAKKADVSVGIIYQYFNDKKDIFIEGVKDYSNNIMYPMLNILETNQIKFSDLKSVMESMIDNFIKTHTISKKAHEELMAMAHLDEDVSNIFNNSELEMTEKIVSLLENNNMHIKNAYEKVHIAIGLIDNLCHEIVYHKHEAINYNLMKDEVIDIIVNILK